MILNWFMILLIFRLHYYVITFCLQRRFRTERNLIRQLKIRIMRVTWIDLLQRHEKTKLVKQGAITTKIKKNWKLMKDYSCAPHLRSAKFGRWQKCFQKKTPTKKYSNTTKPNQLVKKIRKIFINDLIFFNF